MKKLTRKSLNELAKTMPVIEESLQMSYVGEEMEHQPILIPKRNMKAWLVVAYGMEDM
ncbi:hypothetical protein LGV59_03305 [Bacteroides fragilis]|nr:hypothetical protein [Bacteroides fragilis]UVS21922.1 hypothetical protein NXV41_03810 [Bacteroides fragilis]